jgi:uncharacterized protein (TIGR03067 family)
MKQVAVLIVLAVASVGLCADPKEPKGDKALNGWWKPQSVVLAGKKIPGEELKPMFLGLSNGNYILNQGDQVDEGTYKVDESANPKTISLVVTRGPDKGKTTLGIYELDNRSMRICLDMSGKTRPTKFESKPDTQSFLANYRNVKAVKKQVYFPQGVGGGE